MSSETESLLRLPQVAARTALSRSALYAKIAAGQFPQPVAIGARAVAWRASEVDAWVESRVPRTGKSAA